VRKEMMARLAIAEKIIMPSLINDRSLEVTNRATRNALAALVLTSIHHAYGAYIYDTPWRLHVVYIAACAAAAIVGPLAMVRLNPGRLIRRVALSVAGVVILVVPVVLIGLVEGVYNHAIKIVLYAFGMPATTMHRLFPPPAYQLPNDFVFEATGVIQIVPALAAGFHLTRQVVRSVRRDWHTPATASGDGRRADSVRVTVGSREGAAR
jgi:hypothetical protein